MTDETTKTPLLVVDDDRAIRKLIERIATRAGFDVDGARDGEEALELLAKKQYELVIVDLMMPRVSGYELVQHIALLDPRPAVIVATAMMNGDVATLDDSLVRRVIKKPFDINAVAAALVETAKQIAEQRALAEAELPVAPPEAATLPVIVDVPAPPGANKKDKPPAVSDEKPANDEKEVN
ncbi:MAG TPA: response regulator [Thermoanaerobaculia bacterium]|nr:response regulator [Thermoanaerobaculia bacterium]